MSRNQSFIFLQILLCTYILANSSAIDHCTVPPLDHMITATSSNSPCYNHITFHHLYSEDFPHKLTRNTPMKLTSRKRIYTNPAFNRPLHQNQLRLNIFKNRAWKCETVFLYFNTRLKYGTNYSSTLASWIESQTNSYWVEPFGRKIIEQRFFFVLIPFLERHDFAANLTMPIYFAIIKHELLASYVVYVPNFLIIFENSTCVHHFFNFPALFTNFICQDTPQFEKPAQTIFFHNPVAYSKWEVYEHDDYTPSFVTIGDQLSVKTKNPFRDVVNVNKYFLELFITEKINVSDNFRQPISWQQAGLLNSVTNELLSTMHSGLSQYTPNGIMIDSVSYNFITCYKTIALEFDIYYMPFDLLSWIAIGFSIIAITTILHVYIVYYIRTKTNSILLLVLGSLLDEAPVFSSKVSDQCFIRCIIIPWLVMCTVLCSAYTGLLIEHLNSPLAEKMYSVASDLYCEPISNITWQMGFERAKLRGKISVGIMNYYVENTSLPQDLVEIGQSKDHCFTSLSTFTDPYSSLVLYDKSYKFSRAIRDAFGIEWTEIEKLPYLHPIYWFLNPKHVWFPKSLLNWGIERDITHEKLFFETERELTNCAKSVFWDTQLELDSYLAHLKGNYPLLSFYKGKEALLPVPVFLQFQADWGSQVPIRFERIVEAGIYSKVLEYSKLNEKNKFKNSTRNILEMDKFKSESYQSAVPLRIGSNLQTLFIIILILLGSAGLEFFLERGWNKRKFYCFRVRKLLKITKKK
ncbi:hypothetical protein Fcan01_23824 [Folsomia candida]|uniref:Uncharacterized protein n=1 Tax=Folsomia candida TaxID=158441 RepID=A0A226D8G0_FOLCA|nr:hypothetical protein Fcan01_23824 [Folsomia candida]